MKKEKAVIISDAICGIIVILSILVYLVLGLTINWWHPGWIIVVSACMVSAIISVVTSMIVELKKSDKENKQNAVENAEDNK